MPLIVTPTNHLEPIKDRKQLLAALKGQTITLPNVSQYFQDWVRECDAGFQSRLSKLREVVNDRIKSLNLDSKKDAAHRKADFALITIGAWPLAHLQELITLAYLNIWLFTWDDEVDDPDGTYSANMLVSEKYRATTIAFVKACLDGRPESVSLPADAQIEGPISILKSFQTIGEALHRDCTQYQRDEFFRTLLHSMKGSAKEQSIKIDNIVPSEDEFWNLRLATSAVDITLALNEYAAKINLPKHIMESDDMRAIWVETNVMICIINDFFSLKKEYRQECIESLVPVDFAFTQDLDLTVQRCVRRLKASKARFEGSSKRLIEKCDHDARLITSIDIFVENCRSNVLGGIVWSKQTPRYDMQRHLTASGDYSFTF